MGGIYRAQQVDYDGDTRTFSVPTTEITAANHDAQKALYVALNAAIAGISACNTRYYDVVADHQVTGLDKPTAPLAQVNIEWQVTYVLDTSGAVRTVRIAGADLSIADILLPSSNIADLTNTEMAAFKSAFEDLVVEDGETVTVQQVAFLE